jgi:hypothetical protein
VFPRICTCAEPLLRSLFEHSLDVTHRSASRDASREVVALLRFLSVFDESDGPSAASSISSSVASGAMGSGSACDFVNEERALALARYLADRKQWAHVQDFAELTRCSGRLSFQHLLALSFVAQHQFDKAKVRFEKAATLFGTLLTEPLRVCSVPALPAP